MEVDPFEVQRLCQANAVKWTSHVAQRLILRNISPDEVIDVLMHGEIIEQYPTDYPYPSCLVFSVVHHQRPLHVVCSIGEEQVFIITAYEPDPNRWDDSFKYRKQEADE